MDELSETLLPFIKEHFIALIFDIVGISCLGFGLLSFVQRQPSQDDNFQQKQTDLFETKP